MGCRSNRGSATVEHTGLTLLVALLCAALAGGFLARGPDDESRELARAIAQKIRCAPRLPGPCWQDPLTEAYGRGLAGLARALAPVPAIRVGPGGTSLLPVDFRRCRQTTCAAPGGSAGLTASNRRVTAFLSIDDRRRADGMVLLDYWLYRPTLGWERVRRTATSADVASYGMTPLLETDNPRLVPLETLAGRNHVRFSAGEEPPWRWKVESAYELP